MKCGLGEDVFQRISPCMKSFHGQGGHVRGVFAVSRGLGWILRVLAAIGGLPSPSPDPPGFVVLTADSDGTGPEHRVFDPSLHPSSPETSCDLNRGDRTGGSVLNSHFRHTRHGGISEDVLGGLLRFRFQVEGAPGHRLLPRVDDVGQCIWLYDCLPAADGGVDTQCPRAPAAAPPSHDTTDVEEESARPSCLAVHDEQDPRDAETWGWRSWSSDMWGLFGLVPLPSWLTMGIQMSNVIIPHADHRGWFVQVRATCWFGELVHYAGHVRMPVSYTHLTLPTIYSV